MNISFEENGSYKIDTELLFKAPQLDKRSLMHLLNNNNFLLEKLKTQKTCTQKEEGELFNLCALYMLCIFNEHPQAMNYLEQSKYYLKIRTSLYQTYKDCQRILRKVKYN